MVVVTHERDAVSGATRTRHAGRRTGGGVIAPRWRKVLRDLEARPGRSLLAALAMAAGVFEIGTLLVAYAVLDPVLRTMYDKTPPGRRR